MCSINEEGQAFPEKSCVPNSAMGRKCMKCDNTATVVIRMNDPMCKECFLSYATHKFRSAFGKSRVVRDHENVLVAFSCGSASCALVHLIQEGLSKRAHKKLRFLPTLVYIDESLVTGLSASDSKATTDEAVSRMKATGLPFYVYPIEQVMQLDGVSEEEAAVAASGPHLPAMVTSGADDNLEERMTSLRLTADEAREEFTILLNSTKTLTAKERLLQIFRDKLLAQLAQQHGMDKVLTGDSATRMSVHLLSGITQGRGAQLPCDVNFASKRYGDVYFIRPLRDFTAKEVALYVSLTNQEPMSLPTLATKAPSLASLQRLTQDFVAGLQAEFPNTTNTIVRTGDKFAMGVSASETKEKCCMCQCPLDTDVEDCSALNATQFSQTLCANMAARNRKSADIKPANQSDGSVALTTAANDSESCCSSTPAGSSCTTAPSSECCGQGDGTCNAIKDVTRADIERHLCFPCRTLLRDVGDVRHLPRGVLHEAGRRTRRLAMRETIQDCLLED